MVKRCTALGTAIRVSTIVCAVALVLPRPPVLAQGMRIAQASGVFNARSNNGLLSGQASIYMELHYANGAFRLSGYGQRDDCVVSVDRGISGSTSWTDRSSCGSYTVSGSVRLVWSEANNQVCVTLHITGQATTPSAFKPDFSGSADPLQLCGSDPRIAERPATGGALPRGYYRIHVIANNRFWHEHGLRDRLVSTRYQANDAYTVFLLEPQSDGSYRIRVQANGRYLHVDGSNDRLLSTRYQVDDDFTRFYFEPAGQGSYRIRVKATNRYLHENGLGDQLVSTRMQPRDDFTRFSLLPVR